MIAVWDTPGHLRVFEYGPKESVVGDCWDTEQYVPNHQTGEFELVGNLDDALAGYEG